MKQGGNRQTEKLLMERSVPGRVGSILPELDVPAQPLPDDALLRSELPLPEVSEPEVVSAVMPTRCYKTHNPRGRGRWAS